ncbi:MAG: adenylate/guanylate cyclase domain-containing protein [bacterium]
MKIASAAWGTAIGIAAAAIFILLQGMGLLSSLEHKSYDWRMRATRSAETGSGENVALLYVDEPSLRTMQEMGISWPWPRELYAGALAFARRGGAKAVLFDLFFSEDSSYGVADDEAFARGIADGPPSYFVFFASSNEGEPAPVDSEVISRSRVPFGGRPPDFLPEARSLKSLPVPAIAKNAAGFGNAQTPPDDDGIFRRLPPAMRMGDLILPEIAFEVAAAVGNFREVDWPSRTELTIDGQRIPLDANGNMMINYIGGVDSYPTYPLAKVLLSSQQIKDGLTPDLDPAVFKDRVVIVGVAAPGLYDLKPTPLARVYPGPEIQATIIDSLLRRDFIKPLATIPKVLLIFALALATSLGLAQMRRLNHIVPWIAGLAGAYIAAAFVLFRWGAWLPVAAPVGAMALAAFSMVLRNYLTEGRKKHAIKKAFGQYLSPAVVSEIAKDPESVKMGGAEQEVSIFFSDIADFTTISEKLAPTELVSQLCSYLTSMTEIVTSREGTLDKYIGDAVMAFWGAPLAIEDHAAQATLAALEIQESLASFPQFKTRIGIHTGKAVIGNIGSELRFNYTAIGDSVNLASRLEGLNKRFGTRIIISQTTYEEAREKIEARMIGKARVKGRSQPIQLYEPLSPKGGLSAEKARSCAEFSEAMQLFMAADFSGAGKAFARLDAAGDPVVAYYIAICDRFAKSPPAHDFDGVINFHEK